MTPVNEVIVCSRKAPGAAIECNSVLGLLNLPNKKRFKKEAECLKLVVSFFYFGGVVGPRMVENCP